LLDYYDDWNEVDPRLSQHYEYLSRAADIFGHDLVNVATYSYHILHWLQPDQIMNSESVVVVGGMTESFLVSVRSACDAIAYALAYKACEKANQAPSGSLHALAHWTRDNQSRVHPAIAAVLSDSLSWFWNLRTLRDHIVHFGAHATIQCDGRQFNLWIHSPRSGWVTREPLLPLLAQSLRQLVAFGDRAANAINGRIDMPHDRIRSRAVEGVYIPALHSLLNVANQYAARSP
jgi:hypothetical protein